MIQEELHKIERKETSNYTRRITLERKKENKHLRGKSCVPDGRRSGITTFGRDILFELIIE